MLKHQKVSNYFEHDCSCNSKRYEQPRGVKIAATISSRNFSERGIHGQTWKTLFRLPETKACGSKWFTL